MSEKLNAEPLTTSAPVQAERGILFVISSPSGGGKGTLIRRILTHMPRLGYSVSWTTRAPRQGETNGRDYHFVTPEEFAAARERGEFLEWAVVHGNLYGTSLKVVERELAAGRDIVLEIDVQGAAIVRQAGIEAVSIFILPPSFEILRRRLTGRQSENSDALALRLRNSRGEVEHYKEFDYLVLNDDVERAATQLSSIVYAERARRVRQERLAERVLETFP
ncbi:MAG TPA: guanylate kinase [Pyrinomonadaceae bacterium]|nr:guanylate kinase [Pyrinomonadaceae bacterium]